MNGLKIHKGKKNSLGAPKSLPNLKENEKTKPGHSKKASISTESVLAQASNLRKRPSPPRQSKESGCISKIRSIGFRSVAARNNKT